MEVVIISILTPLFKFQQNPTNFYCKIYSTIFVLKDYSIFSTFLLFYLEAMNIWLPDFNQL